jgi:hypothetical protein
MRSSSTARYRKSTTCPTTETLLRFARGKRSGEVARHVAGCDFCGGAAQLLTRFPTREQAPSAPFATIPHSLLRLAEEMLTLPSVERARFAEFIQEIDRLTLTDA